MTPGNWDLPQGRAAERTAGSQQRVVMPPPRIGDKVRHKKFGWECTVTAIEPGWITLEENGILRTQTSAHITRYYETA